MLSHHVDLDLPASCRVSLGQVIRTGVGGHGLERKHPKVPATGAGDGHIGFLFFVAGVIPVGEL